MATKKKTSTNSSLKSLYLVKFQDDVIPAEKIVSIKLPAESYNKQLGGLVTNSDIKLSILITTIDTLEKLMADHTYFDVTVELNDNTGNTYMRFDYGKCYITSLLPSLFDYTDNGVATVDVDLKITGKSKRETLTGE